MLAKELESQWQMTKLFTIIAVDLIAIDFKFCYFYLFQLGNGTLLGNTYKWFFITLKIIEGKYFQNICCFMLHT